MRLDLSSTQFGALEIEILARALKSGKCPAGLQLNLGHNNIDAEAVNILGEVLQSKKCPLGLQLFLDNNSFSEQQVQMLLESIGQNIAITELHLPGGFEMYQQEIDILCLRNLRNKLLD